MRLRITQQPIGSVDGIRLDDFIVGFVYDIGTILGSYLLAQGLAEPADDDATGLVPPLNEIRFTVIRPSSDDHPATQNSDDSEESPSREPVSEAADRKRSTTPKRRSDDPSSV